MSSAEEKSKPESAAAASIAPKGTLVHLKINQLRPTPGNPRRLFDKEPLARLKSSIQEHGVLVPLTVYRLPGQDKYGIVDGERRYRCCRLLEKEGVQIQIPANVVEPPNAMASLVYMFNIHQFREQWELMPTARALKAVIKMVSDDDPEELHQITGLSFPQIERCKKILTFPERFQKLSLEEDPKERIPSNFWVELYPVLQKTEEVLPEFFRKLTRDGITDKLIEKYRKKKIRSVIHFRRILEAFDVAETQKNVEEVGTILQKYILDINLETREAFDRFILDPRRIARATDAADRFMHEVRKAKIDHTEEGREQLVEKLQIVITFAKELIDKLEGGDEPPEEENGVEENE